MPTVSSLYMVIEECFSPIELRRVAAAILIIIMAISFAKQGTEKSGVEEWDLTLLYSD